MPTSKRIRLPFKATEKQQPFVHSSAMFKLGGGARGGGKSHTLAGIAVLLSFMYPGNVGYMGRADLLDFKKTTLGLVLDLIPSELLIRHQAQDHYIDLLSIDGKTPSRMWYGEMKDPGSLLSGNLGWFFIDEAYQVPLETFVNLSGALRGNLPNGQPRPFHALLASNPAPGWLMEAFPVTEEEQHLYAAAVATYGPNFQPFPSPFQPNPDTVKYIDPDYAYFPFRAIDNPFNGPGYHDRILKQYTALGPEAVARYVYGSWEVGLTGLVHNVDNSSLWRPKQPGQRLYRPGLPVVLCGDPSNGAGIYAVNVLQRWRDRWLVVDEFHKEGGTDEDFRDWLGSQPYHANVDDAVWDSAKPDTIKRLRTWGIPVRGMRRKKDVAEQIVALNLHLAVDAVKGYAPVLIDEVYCQHTIAELRKRVYRPANRRIQGARVSELPIKANDHHCNALEYYFYDTAPYGPQAGTRSVQQQVYEARPYMNLFNG